MQIEVFVSNIHHKFKKYVNIYDFHYTHTHKANVNEKETIHLKRNMSKGAGT